MSYRPDLQERAVLPMKETNGFHTVRSPDSFALGQLLGKNAENLGGTLELEMRRMNGVVECRYEGGSI